MIEISANLLFRVHFDNTISLLHLGSVISGTSARFLLWFIRLCVCVSMCVHVTIAHTGRISAKIKNVKHGIRRFIHLLSKGVIAKIAIVILTYF